MKFRSQNCSKYSISPLPHHVLISTLWLSMEIQCTLNYFTVAGPCYIPGDPMSYTDDVSVSRNGIAYVHWVELGPLYRDADFPEQSVTAASNFCRNPPSDPKSGPWCYVYHASNNVYVSELCDLSLCSSIGPYLTDGKCRYDSTILFSPSANLLILKNCTTTNVITSQY